MMELLLKIPYLPTNTHTNCDSYQLIYRADLQINIQQRDIEMFQFEDAAGNSGERYLRLVESLSDSGPQILTLVKH